MDLVAGPSGLRVEHFRTLPLDLRTAVDSVLKELLTKLANIALGPWRLSPTDLLRMFKKMYDRIIQDENNTLACIIQDVLVEMEYSLKAR